MIEPGRSIVSDSGIALARVAVEKRIAGVHNLISLDLGVVNYCEPIVAWPARHFARNRTEAARCRTFRDLHRRQSLFFRRHAVTPQSRIPTQARAWRRAPDLIDRRLQSHLLRL